MNTCSNCHIELVSRFEEKLNRCVVCIETIVTTAVAIHTELDEKITELASLETRLSQAQSSLKRQGILLEIEKMGREACGRGLSLDQNPCDDEDERVMWANGWTQERILEQLSRCVAVMRWTVDTLELATELASARDDMELVYKLDTIRQKISSYVEDVS